jgi:hypothetical protein
MLAPSLVAGIQKRHHRGVWSSVSAGKLRGELAAAAVLAAAGMLSASSIPNLTSVLCRTPERFQPFCFLFFFWFCLLSKPLSQSVTF